MSYNISTLPKEIQDQVNDFIEFLMMKYEKEAEEKDSKADPKGLVLGPRLRSD